MYTETSKVSLIGFNDDRNFDRIYSVFYNDTITEIRFKVYVVYLVVLKYKYDFQKNTW